MRVGTGYDIHRLVEGRRLVLGGVDIPFPRGLDGHSDADVVVHAIMDALLGAAGLPDIGQLFPPTDKQYKDADGLKLLEKVRARVTAAGFRIANVDAVLIAEEPRIAPYVSAMRERMAAALDIPMADVNVKATTNERMGREGRGEAMSAMAVALLTGK